MKIQFTLLLFIISGCSVLAQQFPNLKFNQLTVKDGLSTNAVKCTYEDQNGIMWIATSKGLNRYDGTGIKVYRHNDDDPNSICNDALKYIVADKEHYLWLSTINGLSRFNPVDGKAVNYFHDKTNKNSLATNEKSIPFLDSKGRLWLATDAGVQLFDYKRGIFTTYEAALPEKPFANYVHNSFIAIREDASHQLWAIGASGIYQIDVKGKKLIYFDKLSDDIYISFYQSKTNGIYVGGLNGSLMSFKSGLNGDNVKRNQLFKVQDARVNDIAEWRDNSRKNWLCMAAGSGFILVDMETGMRKEYLSDNEDQSSLRAFSVFQITKDKQNRLWLATDNGINIIDPNLQNFENLALYQQINVNNPKLFGLPNNMLSIDQRYYLTSYYAKGIYVFNKDWKLEKHIKKIPDDSSPIGSKSINSIYKDAIGNFWFSTDSGLVKQAGNDYKFYFPPKINRQNKEEPVISKLYKRKDGLFWIRARTNGIYLFNPLTGAFLKQYKSDSVHIDGTVFSCFLDKEDTFWIGATNGISRYNPKNDVFDKIRIRRSNEKETDVTWVTDITEDRDGVIWAVSDVGLIKINKRTNSGILLNTKDGLPENYLKRILVDTTGYLWIPSQQGIIRYNRKDKFTFFNINNGLPYQYEGHGFFEFDPQGNMLLGFSGFVTRFNPYQIKINSVKPEVVFMDLSVDGKPIHIQTKNKECSVTLTPGTKLINIHFAVTNYTAPQENNYYYKLGEGAAHWQQVKNGDIALGSLPNGTYTIHIKGSNNDDVFSAERKLSIVVLPHWYETVLFVIICLLSIAFLSVILIRRRIAVIRKESLFKQKLIQSELTAIRAQMNPHFIFNVLNSIESYIVENDSKTASRLVQKFAGLTRLILENSTQSLVSVGREWKALELYTELEAIRFNHLFAYRFIRDNTLDLNKLQVPPMLIQPLIENAIHHGLRNCNHDDGLVTIDLVHQNDQLIFTVKDNGIGLHAAQFNKTNKSLFKQQSLALKGIEERILAINNSAGKQVAFFEIKDISADGKSGTVAILTLPALFL